MPSYLPASKEIRVTQQTGAANSKALEALDQLLLILPRRIPGTLWRRVPQGAKLQALMRKRPAGQTPSLETRLPNKKQTLVVAGRIGADAEAFELLSFARKLVAAATREKAGNLGILVLGFDTDDQQRLCEYCHNDPVGVGGDGKMVDCST